MKLLRYILFFFICLSTQIATSSTFNFLEIDPPVINGNNSVCSGGNSVTLTATGTGTITWYTDPSGSSIHTGSNYTITNLTTTTTYYAKATDGTEEEISTGFTITVHPNPTVSINLPPTNSCSGSSVSFSTNTNNGTAPYTYAWNFGDGSTGTGATPSHTYTSLGCGTENFSVEVSVTDTNGCTATTQQNITIKKQPDILLTDLDDLFAPEPFNNCGDASLSNPSYTINVGNSSPSGSCITEYTIDWGDSSPDVINATFPLQHTYTELGVYSLSVTAQAANGCNITKVYTVKNVSNPAGGLSSPGSTTNLCAPTDPLNFEITNWQSNSPGTIYTVDYGDGTPPLVLNHPLNNTNSNQSVPHIYEISNCPDNEFIATLTISNACGETVSTINAIKIIKKPEPSFTNPEYACVNTNVTFTNTSITGFNSGCTTIALYTWDFGDGTQQSVGPVPSPQNITHQYSAPGEYIVTLTAQNGCGTSDPYTNTICIEAPLTASFSLDNTEACGSLNAQATNTTDITNTCDITYNWSVSYSASNCGTSPGNPYNYFTNSTSSNSENPSFNFPNPGTYTVTLTASNSCGSEQATETVIIKNPPTVTINNIDDVCGGSSASISPAANITNCGSGTLSYLWSFPGGTPSSSTSENPGTITYSTSGNYTITLEVTNECGTTTGTQDFYVTPSIVVNAGDDETVCADSGSVQLSGSATGGTGSGYQYSWTPTTGLTNANIDNPTATPTATTTYTLSVTNNGCTATDEVTVYVNTVNEGVIGENQTICNGDDPNVLSVTSPANGEGTITYQWESSTTSATTGFSNIAGATNDTYDPEALTQTTWFRRKATSTLNTVACEATSNTIEITVNTITAGTIQDSQTICSGGTPGSLITDSPASGGGTLTYQWQSSTDNITFTDIIGATNTTYDPPVLTQATWYRRIAISSINNVDCSDFSNTVAITLTTPPSITQEPLASQTLCSGGSVTDLTITAIGNGTLNYQWYSNTANSTTGGTALSGETNDTFTPLATTVGTTYYYCIVSTTEAGCTDTSGIAEVTVIAAPTFTSQPQSQTLCEDETPALLSVTYQNGTGTPTYQWYSNTVSDNLSGTPIAGETGTTYQPDATLGVMYYYATITFPGGGCSLLTSDIASITINTIPVVTTNETQTICSGATFDVTPTDGSGNTIPAGTTYTWTNPTGTGFNGGSAQIAPTATISQTLTNSTENPVTATYTITPIANNCSGTPFTATITINPTPVITDQTITVCSDETFTLTPTNGGGNTVPTGTTYSWAAPTEDTGLSGGLAGTDLADISGVHTNNTNTTQTATYTVTPVWNSGTETCSGNSFTVTVTVKPKPIINTITTTSCSGTLFTVTPEEGTDGTVPANTTYSWDTPSAPAEISGLSAGSGNTISGNIVNTGTSEVTITYVVTPEADGCEGDTFNVSVTIAPTPTVNAISSQTVCNGSDTETISVTGDVINTQFNWTNDTPSIGLAASGTGDIAVFQAANTNTTPITATITVTPEINGCEGISETFTITVNPAPIADFSIADQTICSGTTSDAVTLSSATPNTNISWTATIPTGVTGVEASGTTTIPAQTLINNTDTPLTVTYTATATTADASACPGASSVYSITVTPVPYVNDPQEVTICNNDTMNFIPVDGGNNNIPAGTTFTWSSATGTGFTGGDAQTTPQTSINPILVNTTNQPVTATFTVTPEFGGCIGIAFDVTIIINPSAIVTDASITLCSGDSFTFDPATIATLLPNGTVYNWNAPTGDASGGTSGINESTISDVLNNTSTTTQTAVYTVTPVSPDGNCEGTPFNITVTVNPVFDVSSTVSDYNGFEISTAGADDGFINLTPTGGTGTYTYDWSGPDGFTSLDQNTADLAPGDYTVSISDGLCSDITLNFTVDEPLPLVIVEVASSHVDVDCYGASTGVIEVEITQVSIAPFDYVILLNDGTVIESAEDVNATNYVFDNLPAGIYDIQVTDANGTLKYINDIEITQPSSGLEITNATITDFNGFNISCNGAQDAAIDITVSGGYPSYTYSWTGPDGFTATTEDINTLSPGIYTVVINDTTNSCPLTESYTIIEPDTLAFTGVVSDFNGYQVACNGGSSGSININPTGGTGVYTYSWTGSNGFTSSNQNLTDLVVGTYEVTVTDSNGCAAPSQAFILTEPPVLTVTETHVDVLCYGAATGAIDVSVSGGVSNNYIYSWTGPNGFTSNLEDLTDVVAGDYSLTATDDNGCEIVLNVTITQQPEIIITPTTTPITCYGADNASISLAITGGNPPYTAEWDNLATGTFQDNLGAGNYVITVTDESGCEKAITVVIPQVPIFAVDPIYNNISCYGASDGSIALNLVGGITPVTLVWSDGSTAGITRNNLGPGTYTATITDGTPCEIVRTFTIVEPAELTATASINHALDCDDTMSGSINLFVAGGTPPYVYQWSNGENTEDLLNITSGTYSVTITDANGCSTGSSYNITRPAPITLNVTNDVNFNCDAHTVLQTNIAQAAGGVPPFEYSWSSGTVSGQFGQFMNTDQNGTVIVTATDSYGCTATTTFEVETELLGEADYLVNSYAQTTYQTYSIFDPITFENLSTGDYLEVGWNFGDGSVSSDINPMHTYVREGIYTVILNVVYPYGCTDEYRMNLEVTKGYDLMVPNAFTPNADGINDTFNAVHTGLRAIELNIYDTWGSLIYSEKGEVITGWNGYIKGIPSENGNFYYRIKAETFYGQIIDFEGPFVLIK